MAKMTKKMTKSVRKLAVSYSAYNEATNDNSKKVWARLLADAIEETGIDLYDVPYLRMIQEKGPEINPDCYVLPFA